MKVQQRRVAWTIGLGIVLPCFGAWLLGFNFDHRGLDAGLLLWVCVVCSFGTYFMPVFRHMQEKEDLLVMEVAKRMNR